MGRISKRHREKQKPCTLFSENQNVYNAGIYARISADHLTDYFAASATGKSVIISADQPAEYSAKIPAGIMADLKRLNIVGADEEKKWERYPQSILNQIAIAQKYIRDYNDCHEDEICVFDFYIDIGKTGANFERKEFQRMMDDVRDKKINCIVVKDLSRFGRNYLEVGNYLEKIYPFLGVRFISVTDNLDLNSCHCLYDPVPMEIKNLINDMYVKDFSIRARASLNQRRKDGSYVGGVPPYGYCIEWGQKIRKLVPDTRVEGLIPYIFHTYLETKSYQIVANKLNEKRINPPAEYYRTGNVYCPKEEPYKEWNKSAVERILKNAAYTGRLIQGKSSIYARCEKNRIKKDESEWIVIENAHEALVSPELFRLVQLGREKDWC